MTVKSLLTNAILTLAALLMLAGCACDNEAACVGRAEVMMQAHGLMRVRVLDGVTDRPIEGACIVIPEADQRSITDERGLTHVMELPCLVDEGLSRLLPYDEGRVTLLVYAEGYIPYLLLYCRVLPGKERETPTIYMWPDDGSLPVFEVIEAPPLEWAAELAKKYEP